MLSALRAESRYKNTRAWRRRDGVADLCRLPASTPVTAILRRSGRRVHPAPATDRTHVRQSPAVPSDARGSAATDTWTARDLCIHYCRYRQNLDILAKWPRYRIGHIA